VNVCLAIILKIQRLDKHLSEAQSQRDNHLNSSQEWKNKFVDLEEKFKALSGILGEVQKENGNLKEAKQVLDKNILVKENEVSYFAYK